MPPKRRFQPPTPDSFASTPSQAPAKAFPTSQRRRPNARPSLESFISPSNNAFTQHNYGASPTPSMLQRTERRTVPSKLPRAQLDPELLEIKQEQEDDEEDMILPSSTPIRANSPEQIIIPASDAPTPQQAPSPSKTITIGPFTPRKPQRGNCQLDAILIPDSSPIQFRTPIKTPTKRTFTRTASGLDSIQSQSDMSSPFRFPSNNPTPKRARSRWFEDVDEDDDDDGEAELEAVFDSLPPTPVRRRPPHRTPIPRQPVFTTTPKPRSTTPGEEVHTSDSDETVTLPTAKRQRLKHHDSVEESQDALAHIKIESDNPNLAEIPSRQSEDDEDESQNLLTDPFDPVTPHHFRTPAPTKKFTPASAQWSRFTVPTPTPLPGTKPPSVKPTPTSAPSRKPHKTETPVRIIRIVAIGDTFPDGGRLIWGFFEVGARNDEERRGGAMILSAEGASRSKEVRVGGRVGLFGVGWRVMVKVGMWWRVRGRWMPLREEVKDEDEGIEHGDDGFGVEMPEVDERGYDITEMVEHRDVKEEVGEDLPVTGSIEDDGLGAVESINRKKRARMGSWVTDWKYPVIQSYKAEFRLSL
ncbi:hypothetical protein BJ508DRAFT_365394 [Ascobolus immersus RN42]|uniref:Uncharacterized protein n=1 Tax=Ascobolus immersus RN42 TaxID=1160509 RepID=A0A3N4HSD3_ASCIM|nr:hypothetical protein BJ508DRAFT_365394 [Ascobolus immersus RN42]